MSRRLHPFAAFFRPSLLGAAYLSGLVVRNLLDARRDERVLGVTAPHVARAITQAFAGHLQQTAGTLLSAAVLGGFLLGTLAGLLVHVRERLERRPRTESRKTWRALGETFAVIVALHAATYAYAAAVRPQLYGEDLYDRGGLRRLVHVLLTDILGPRGVSVLVAMALVAYLIGPRRSWRRRFEHACALLRHYTFLAPLAGLALLVVMPSSPPKRRPHDATRPNVIVLATDSLRPDRITPAVAPVLANFAASAVTFDDAQTTIARTFPSWVTWLTGRDPHHHGIRTMFPSRRDRARSFDALPERLRRADYHTGIVSDYAGDIFPRIDLGFERVLTPTFHFGELIRQRGLERQTALLPLLDNRLGRQLVPSFGALHRASDPHGVAQRTLNLIDEFADRPFFVVAFFSTAHFPYAAPSPGYGMFTDPHYRGRFKYEKSYLPSEAPLDQEDIRQVRALYDGAVHTVDAAIGRVLTGLESRRLADNTIVLVTADHGETLFEAGRGHGHGDHLFGDESLRVPLLIREGHIGSPHRVSDVVRDVDVAPTLYELLHVPPPGDLDGRSLLPALRGTPLEERPAFAETEIWFTEQPAGVPPGLRLPYPDISGLTEVDRSAEDDVVLRDEFKPIIAMAKHRAITTRQHRLVLVPTRHGLQTFLFDRVADPHHEHDLRLIEPDQAASLKSELLRWVLRDGRLELREPHLVPQPAAFSAEPSSTNAFRLDLPTR